MAFPQLLAICVSLVALTGCEPRDKPTTNLLAEARQLLADNRYDAARVAIERVLKADARNPDAYLLQGRIADAAGDPGAAFEAYAQADASGARDLQARYRMIDLLLGSDHLDAAAERVNAMLGDRPDDIGARAYRARIEAAQGSTFQARVDAQSVLAKDPGNATANAALALASLTDNNPGPALEATAAGLAAHPADTDLLRLKAKSLIMQQAFEAAVRVYLEVVRLAPRSMPDHVALASVQAEAGQVDAGERTLRQALEAAPGELGLHLQMASFLARYKGPAAAVEDLRRAIGRTPDKSALDLALAELQARSGQTAVGIDTLRAAVRRLPEGAENRRAQVGLARLSLATGDRQGARALLDGVLSQDAADDDAISLRATQKIAAGDASAVDDLLAVAGRHPTSGLPFALLAQAYFAQGKTDEGLGALKRAADADPGSAAAAVTLADALMRFNRQDDAKRTIDRYIDHNPAAVEGLVAAVQLAIGQKDWSSADTRLQELRRLSGGERPARVLGAEVSEAKGSAAEAAMQFKAVIDGDPVDRFDQRAADAFVRTSVASGQGPEAVATLAVAAARTTGVAKTAATLTLATLHRRLGQEAEALGLAEGAAKLSPKDAPAYLLQAEILGGRQQVDAVRVLNDGIRAGAPGELLLLARASLEIAARRTEAAVGTYREILHLAPGSLVAANNLASLIADHWPDDRDRLTAAKAELERLAPESLASTSDTLGWIDYRLGNFDAARKRLEQAGAGTALEPQLLYHYGAVLIAIGQKAQGQTLVRSALSNGLALPDEAATLLAQ